MAMMDDGSLVPLDEEQAKKLLNTGLHDGTPATLVRVGDQVVVNGRLCHVRKVTRKDIILRPAPWDVKSERVTTQEDRT